uniref:Uncharacterized protein n=1 Tax=Panagrolaimus superbus TaxID=310955 RepID=A0A914YCF5_9BILA
MELNMFLDVEMKKMAENLTDLYKELKANGQIDHMRSGQVYWNAEKNGKSSSSSDVVVPTSPSSGNANVPVSNKSDPPSRSYPRRNLSPRDE